GGVVHLGEGGDHGFFVLRFGDEAQQNFGDDAESPFGADEKVFERIAGDIFHAFVSEPHDVALGKDDFHSHHVIAGDAVFETAQAAGVFGNVSADGGNAHRPRIGRIKEPGS